MRRATAAFAFMFVASLVLAAYGHCWPMLAAQIDSQAAASHEAHDHGGHRKQHHHPSQGLGQELSVAGVHAEVSAIAPPQVAKVVVPVLLALEEHGSRIAGAQDNPPRNARAGPPAFAEFHARTGRLLI
jgi:hypothetical protein